MNKQYQKQKLEQKEKGYQQAIKDILNYLSERGFRESNYEINELTRWLRLKKNDNA